MRMSKQIDSQGALKFLDFQFLRICGSVRLSVRLCTEVLVRFVRFRLFMNTVNSFRRYSGSVYFMLF